MRFWKSYICSNKLDVQETNCCSHSSTLTALPLEDCLDISSNMVKLFVERVPLEARADRSVSLEVQDSAEMQADETSLSAVMSVDSGHRAITVEAAADVCKGPLCCGGGREAHLQSVLQSISVRRWLDDSIEWGVLRYTHTSTTLEHSTSPLDDTIDATRRTHELALCDRCHTAWASGAHFWVPAGQQETHVLFTGWRPWVTHSRDDKSKQIHWSFSLARKTLRGSRVDRCQKSQLIFDGRPVKCSTENFEKLRINRCLWFIDKFVKLSYT